MLAMGCGGVPARADVPVLPLMTSAPNDTASLYQRLIHDLTGSLPALTIKQMDNLWRQAFQHRVAGLDDAEKMRRYDPTEEIGFCFGRAMALHLMARRLGLQEGAIAKLFIIGDLRSAKDPEWRFHVTMLARGPKGTWYAIDPIRDGPLPVEDWIAQTQGIWDKEKKAWLYITPASAVMPDLRSVPDVDQEKGEHLIEISFNPARHRDLTRELSLGPQAYVVSPEAARRYFSAVDSRPPFDFSESVINGKSYVFNDYFADLLRDITAPEAPSRFSMQEPEPIVPGERAQPLGLHVRLLMNSDVR